VRVKADKEVQYPMSSRNALIAAAFAGLLAIFARGALAQQAVGPQPAPNPTSQAAVETLPLVSPIFGDNMVLQRNKQDRIWGWSDPGDKITVQIGDTSASAVAGADRRWQVSFQAPPTGGPYTVEIAGKTQSVELHNVLVGDVWLCTGQSNMEFPMRGVLNADQEIQQANYPNIRFFTVAEQSAYRHTDLVKGQWLSVSPQTAARLSAVSYYFARRVQQDIHIPIGLVVDCVGGTPVETWMSEAALRKVGGLEVPLAYLHKLADENAPAYGNYIMHWYEEYDTGLKEDWPAPTYDDSAWKTVDIMNGWSALDVAGTPAVVWFRKEVTLPDPLPAGRSMLFLGVVDRMDAVWINGKYVGGSAWVENPRRYFLRGALKPGKNLIAIRILRLGAGGGFMGKPSDLHLQVGDQNIPLAGDWMAKVSVDARPPQPLPISYENWPVIPSVLYKGMLEPIGSLAISGAIWYQGESNAKRGYEYRKVLPAMIENWRQLFNQGNFPFYIVSLPYNGQRSTTPADDDGWAEVRESQAITAKEVPNTCLAITVDTGDADSVHPRVKEPVGDRLAYCALGQYYGEKIAYQSPTLASWDHLTGAIRLHFAHAPGGVVMNYQPDAFQIAGADRKWYWADAHVLGDTVVVSTSLVQNPVAVRYDWQSNPPAILFNKAGLPAGPFRTDDWPVPTEDAPPY
jgi:sialate O-acetylesterase